MSHAAVARSRAPARDAWLLAAVAFGLYALLGQNTLYGDGAQFAVWSTTGQRLHPVHYLFLPLLNGATALLGGLGLSFHAAACVLSAAGTACGVALVHAACRRLGEGRGACALAAALVATCPGIVFFATVLEVHGVFFAFAALGFCSAAALLRRPNVLRAVGFGLATSAAFAAHASAAILPLPYALWALAETRAQGGPLRPLLRLLALAAGVHVAAVAGLRAWFAALGAPGGEAVRGYFATMGQQTPLWPDVVPTLWYEWVWAFYPVSLLCAAGLRSSAARGHVLALLVALAPYLAVSLVIVRGANEHGAYLMPLAIPAALLVVRTVPRPLALATAAVALVVAVAIVRQHDRPERSRELADGIAAEFGAQPVLLFAATQDELQASLAFLPHSRFVWMGTLLGVSDGLRPALFDSLRDGVHQHVARGGVALLPAGAFRVLQELAASAGGAGTAAALLQHFAHDYRGTPVHRGAFRGQRLER